MAWQDSLFAEEPRALTMDGLRRLRLDERCWLDVGEEWLPGADGLFTWLHAHAPWQQRERWMYDRAVLEPRLVATWSGPDLARLPEPLQQARTMLGEHYAVDLDSVLVNFYRDGRDGVAWHGDTVRHRLPEAVVVTIGLGERRRFLLRPGTAGPATVSLTSGLGDLVVMGGRTQHEWQHTVPKERRTGARMSVTMRHSRPARSAQASSNQTTLPSSPS